MKLSHIVITATLMFASISLFYYFSSDKTMNSDPNTHISQQKTDTTPTTSVKEYKNVFKNVEVKHIDKMQNDEKVKELDEKSAQLTQKAEKIIKEEKLALQDDEVKSAYASQASVDKLEQLKQKLEELSNDK